MPVWSTVGMLIVCCLPFIDFGPFLKRGIRKLYAKDKIIQNLEAEYAFFDDHFEQFHNNDHSTIRYDQVHKIYVTKDNVYIMRSPAAGFIIQNETCPDGFLDFIEKIKKDYKI